MTHPPTSPDPTPAAEALERGEPVAFPACPFVLPAGDDLDFLLAQQADTYRHKDISLDPATGRLGGARVQDPADRARLVALLGAFSAAVTGWVRSAFPPYAPGLVRDRATLRTAEEATRPLRLTARNDLLHIDNFPTRPACGRRILRVYANLHPTDPHVWATSERFPELVARFAVQHRVPARTRAEWLAPAQSVLRVFTGGKNGRSAYDAWMLRLHHFLKEDEAFQATAARKVWTFPPGSAWAVFADGVAYAQLRGRFALEHSFFVPLGCLARPDDAPLAVLERFGAEAARRAG